jgi:hypothetical protein
MFNYLHFKNLHSRRQNLDALFLINVFKKNKALPLWTLLVSVYPLSKLETLSPVTSEMSQDLALQQGASRLQTASANLWTFSINITSLLRIRFPLFNPTELRHYRVTCIVLWAGIKFSLVLVLVLVSFCYVHFKCSSLICHSLLAST